MLKLHKMKTKIIFIIILSLYLIMDSCDILEVKPYDAIPAEEVLTTKKGLDGSIIGAYNALQSGSVSMDAIVFADLAADNLIAIGTKAEYREINNNTIQSTNSYVSALWGNSYEGINLVNYILDGIQGVKGISDEELNNYLGQCYFLRAFHYFNLVRYFGDIPLRDKPVYDASPATLNIPLSTKNEIYELIISDLELAEQYFAGKGKGDVSFANEGAVKALLAKVYLYQKNWTNALAKANEVIAMGYSLEMTDYAAIFNETSVNKEIIFQIDFAESADASNGLNNWLTPYGRFEVAADSVNGIVKKFAPNDSRYNATIAFSTIKGSYYNCNKYLDNVTRKDNVIILRLAEMYLIKAEALNEIGYEADGEAFTALNTIRNRANLGSLSSTEISNQAAFRLAIEDERNFELAFEGNRLFDLRRMGRADAVLPDLPGGTLKSAGWYFPIPQSEIDTNDGIN
jgi:hypothetical protein